MVEVVLPTPPFWLHIAMTLAGPCTVFGLGSGMVRGGRPVRPSSGAPPSSVMPDRRWSDKRGMANIRESLTGRMGLDGQTRGKMPADSAGTH